MNRSVRPICRFAASVLAFPATISIGHFLCAYKPWNGSMGPNLLAALQLDVTLGLIAVGVLFAIAGLIRHEPGAGFLLGYLGVLAIGTFVCFSA